MKEIYSFEIEKDTQYDKTFLSKLKNKQELSKGKKLLYIYMSKEFSIQYPKKIGKVLYIGETCKNKEPSGKRFGEHISCKENKGNNYNSNYTLSYYYWSGKKLNLIIYAIEEKEDRKLIEQNLLKYHVKQFGALPIAQGTTTKNYTATSIENLKLDDLKDITTLWSQ